jgi:hypothetical protein
LYEINCIKCGAIERYKNQSEAMESGCGGCSGTINHKHINIQLCSKCCNHKTLNEELGKQLPEELKRKYGVKANSSQH